LLSSPTFLRTPTRLRSYARSPGASMGAITPVVGIPRGGSGTTLPWAYYLTACGRTFGASGGAHARPHVGLHRARPWFSAGGPAHRFAFAPARGPLHRAGGRRAGDPLAERRLASLHRTAARCPDAHGRRPGPLTRPLRGARRDRGRGLRRCPPRARPDPRPRPRHEGA